MPTSTEATEAMGALLEQMATVWRRSGRLGDYLLSSEDLCEFESYLNSGNVSSEIREFVDASLDLEKIRPKPVHWSYRVAAWIIDFFLVLMLVALILSIEGLLLSKWQFTPSSPTELLINLAIINFSYFCLSYRFGRTPGQWIAGLQVMTQSGTRMTWKRSAARAILNWTLIPNILAKTHISFDTSLKNAKPISVRIVLGLISVMLTFNIANTVFLIWYGASIHNYEKEGHNVFDSVLRGYFDTFGTTPEDMTPYIAMAISGFFLFIIVILMLLCVSIWFKRLTWFRILSCLLGLLSLPSPLGFVFFLFSFHPSFVRYFTPVPPYMRVFLNYRRNKAACRDQK